MSSAAANGSESSGRKLTAIPAGNPRLIHMTLGPNQRVTVFGAKVLEVAVPAAATGPARLKYKSIYTQESDW